MTFPDLIVRLKAAPTAYLDNYSARSLGIFLVGYQSADYGAHVVIRALRDVIPGLEQADACTRAYLSYADSAAGASAILDALEKLACTGMARPERDWFSSTFVDAVKNAIVLGRPAMVLGDATVSSLYNHTRGFLCGLESVAPEEARQQTRRLADFERWMQGYYGLPNAVWYKILQTHYGPCEGGLRKFVDLWDEFEALCPDREATPAKRLMHTPQFWAARLASTFRSLRADGRYTRQYSNFDEATRTAIVRLADVAEHEVPALACYFDEDTCTLLTSERLVWANDGCRSSVMLTEIADATVDPDAFHRAGIEVMTVVTRAGQHHPLRMEAGPPLLGFWNTLNIVGAWNKSGLLERFQ